MVERSVHQLGGSVCVHEEETVSYSPGAYGQSFKNKHFKVYYIAS